MDTLDQHGSNAARCLAVFAAGPDRVTWKFDDATEITTEHDISTDAGRHLFAQAAEKLGLGDRREIASLVKGWQHQEGPILQRSDR